MQDEGLSVARKSAIALLVMNGLRFVLILSFLGVPALYSKTLFEIPRTYALIFPLFSVFTIPHALLFGADSKTTLVSVVGTIALSFLSNIFALGLFGYERWICTSELCKLYPGYLTATIGWAVYASVFDFLVGWCLVGYVSELQQADVKKDD